MVGTLTVVTVGNLVSQMLDLVPLPTLVSDIGPDMWQRLSLIAINLLQNYNVCLI